ncbi:MAG TPA: ribulose-phosphate 3-epimerase [Candidatus Acidoferrales bacterium]
MAEIAPSILAADFSRLGAQIQAVREGGASIIHVDVMDGHFVPNLTVGVPVVASLRKATDLLLDVHLMIEEPERYIPDFAEAGADMISVHPEATHHLDRALQMIRQRDIEAGAAINPATPVGVLSEVLPMLDFVLVMSVNPGFGGQEFLPGSLEKIRQLRRLREECRLAFRIEVDGGVGLENLSDLVRAGAEILVAGTSVFHSPDPAATVREMLKAAQLAVAQKV